MPTSELESEMIHISREDLRELLAEETKKAVEAAFTEIGLYANEPTERAEIRRDFRHLRSWREATEAATGQAAKLVLVAILGGILTIFWVGIRTHFKLP